MKDAPFPSLAADAGAYGNHDAPPHIHVGLNDEDRILGTGGHGDFPGDHVLLLGIQMKSQYYQKIHMFI